MDLTSEKSASLETGMNITTKETEIIYNFIQFTATYTGTSEFTLNNPSQRLLIVLIDIWFQRKVFSHDKRLKLHI